MLQLTLRYIWLFAQVVTGYNLVFPFFLYCIYKLTNGKNKIHRHQSVIAPDYGIIVTAYEQTDSIPAVIESLLSMHYSNYLIYIVADKCDVSNLHFNDSRVVILRPEHTLGSNTRSHFFAINHFKRSHTHLTIIDSDNLADADYLNRLNEYFAQGYQAVQGARKAKNLDTTYSCLDAARDIYYHFYDGRILFTNGSSATLAGSGMAFTTSLYKECLEKLDVTGAGFDKVLQHEIIKRSYRIAFAEDAVVYDEKTSQSDQLVKQRARWINTWFRYFGFGFSLLAKGITRFNLNQFLFGIVLLRPPLFMFILLSLFFTAINIFISFTATVVWLLCFAAFIAGFLIAVIQPDTDKRIYKALIKIPVFMFYQVLSLFKAKRANSYSVATRHYHSHTIDKVS